MRVQRTRRPSLRSGRSRCSLGSPLTRYPLDVNGTLPERWSKFLTTQPETGMDYQVVAVTLRDGRVVEDVAIVHHSCVAEVRGQADIPFDPTDIEHIELTHRKWNFRHAGSREDRAAI
jgi:hypothetical protein